MICQLPIILFFCPFSILWYKFLSYIEVLHVLSEPSELSKLSELIELPEVFSSMKKCLFCGALRPGDPLIKLLELRFVSLSSQSSITSHPAFPDADRNQTIPHLDQALLERMGLGNQSLMVRLRLPLKTSPSLIHETSSPSSPDMRAWVESLNELAMTREMIEETMPGTGTSLGEDLPGKISMKEASLLQGKPISCRILTSPTSNKCFRILSCNKAVQTSPMLWQDVLANQKMDLGVLVKDQHSRVMSQLMTGCVTCHTCHGCVTHFRPILGNIVEVTLVTFPILYIVSHAKGTSFP